MRSKTFRIWNREYLILELAPMAEGATPPPFEHRQEVLEPFAQEWIQNNLDYKEGVQESFQDIYSYYRAFMILKKKPVLNESRFSSLLLLGFQDKTLPILRKKISTKAYFLNLELATRSKLDEDLNNLHRILDSGALKTLRKLVDEKPMANNGKKNTAEQAMNCL